MKHLIVQYLPWVLSTVTVYQSFLAGDKKRSAWVIALFNQVLWLVWVLCSQTWGLLPLNAALWIVYYRNYRKWSVVQEPECVARITSIDEYGPCLEWRKHWVDVGVGAGLYVKDEK